MSGEYSDWFNLRNLTIDTINTYDTVTSIDWETVDKWNPYSNEEVFVKVF